MEINVRQLSNKDMELICKWFQYIANTISGNEIPQENIKTNIPKFISRYIEYIANFFIDDEWHQYDKNNMPKNNETLITQLKDNTFLVQAYNEQYHKFELNDNVIAFKRIKIKRY